MCESSLYTQSISLSGIQTLSAAAYLEDSSFAKSHIDYDSVIALNRGLAMAMFWISSTNKCSWNRHSSSELKVQVLEHNTSDGVNPTILI